MKNGEFEIFVKITANPIKNESYAYFMEKRKKAEIKNVTLSTFPEKLLFYY